MTEPEHEPTMNQRLRGKPPKYDVFARYRTEQPPETDTTDPKETDQ